MEAESRSESAYRQLVAFMGQLDDGQRLPAESDFVDMFGLSRASIREALARLRGELQPDWMTRWLNRAWIGRPQMDARGK